MKKLVPTRHRRGASGDDGRPPANGEGSGTAGSSSSLGGSPHPVSQPIGHPPLAATWSQRPAMPAPARGVPMHYPVAAWAAGSPTGLYQLSPEAQEQEMVQLAIKASLNEQHQRQMQQVAAVAKKTGHDARAELRQQAAALSLNYWRSGCLSYSDKLVDGFYELFGEFPEVVDKGGFPSLDQLRLVTTAEDDTREVVLIEDSEDQNLLFYYQCVLQALSGIDRHNTAAVVQELAKIVVEYMGGTDLDRIDIEWRKASRLEKKKRQSVVVLLCGLSHGSFRHRALLFKRLVDTTCDGILQCCVRRGVSESGRDDVAAAFIKLAEKEYMVDLVASPGALKPAGEFNDKRRRFENSPSIKRNSRTTSSNIPLLPPPPPPNDLGGHSPNTLRDRPGISWNGAVGQQQQQQGQQQRGMVSQDSAGAGSSGNPVLPAGGSQPGEQSPGGASSEAAAVATHPPPPNTPFAAPQADPNSQAAQQLNASFDELAQRSHNVFIPELDVQGSSATTSQPDLIQWNSGPVDPTPSQVLDDRCADSGHNHLSTWVQFCNNVDGPDSTLDTLSAHSKQLSNDGAALSHQSPNGHAHGHTSSWSGPGTAHTAHTVHTTSVFASSTAEAQKAAIGLDNRPRAVASYDDLDALVVLSNNHTAPGALGAAGGPTAGSVIGPLHNFHILHHPQPTVSSQSSGGTASPLAPPTQSTPITPGVSMPRVQPGYVGLLQPTAQPATTSMYAPSPYTTLPAVPPVYQGLSSTHQGMPAHQGLPNQGMVTQGSQFYPGAGGAGGYGPAPSLAGRTPANSTSAGSTQQAAAAAAGSTALAGGAPRKPTALSASGASGGSSSGNSQLPKPDDTFADLCPLKVQQGAGSVPPGSSDKLTVQPGAGIAGERRLSYTSRNTSPPMLTSQLTQPAPQVSQSQQQQPHHHPRSASTGMGQTKLDMLEQIPADRSATFPAALSPWDRSESQSPQSESSSGLHNHPFNQPFNQQPMQHFQQPQQQQQQLKPTSQAGSSSNAWLQYGRDGVQAWSMQSNAVPNPGLYHPQHMHHAQPVSPYGVPLLQYTPHNPPPHTVMQPGLPAAYQHPQASVSTGGSWSPLPTTATSTAGMYQAVPINPALTTPTHVAPTSVSSSGYSGLTADMQTPMHTLRMVPLSLQNEAPSSESWLIDTNEVQYSLKDRLGGGSFGDVYRGTWRKTVVAIKVLNGDIQWKEFSDEVSIMRSIRHPNVVQFLGAVVDENSWAIVTEYMHRGSLFKLLHRSNVDIQPMRRLLMAKDIARGIHYLHTCKPAIVHRDLKSPNLLVDKDWTIKVCDFGLSKIKKAGTKHVTAPSTIGTAEWTAPEVLRSEACNEKSDVFSYGVVLWELVTGDAPWDELEKAFQVWTLVGHQGKRLEVPEDIDSRVHQLIMDCWAEDPAARPDFSLILERLDELPGDAFRPSEVRRLARQATGNRDPRVTAHLAGEM